MVHRIIILTIVTVITAQSNEFVKIKKRILPEYGYHLRNYYAPNNVIDDEFNTWREDDERYKDDKSSEEIVEVNHRRLFEWFSKLFHTTTPQLVASTPTTTESSYTRELKERIFFKELQRNLTDASQKITEIQKRVSDIIDRREAYTFLSKNKQIVRQDYYRRRFKRDETPKTKSIDDSLVDNKIKSFNNTNNSTDNANVTTIGPCAKVTSGRRSGADINPTEIKNKLLLYLEESFQEIENKMTSLKAVKEAFLNNDSFKIGYIIANIDTLEVNMLNLKKNVDDNKHFWEDKKILELYDTLKVSNQAVSGLIESLKMYIEKLSMQS